MTTQKNIYKYDQNGNPSSFHWAAGNTTVLYNYILRDNDEHRKELWISPKNKSNFRTIVKSYFSLSSFNWMKYSMLEIGEVYNTYYKFDNNQKVIYIRRFNKIKKTEFKQITVKRTADSHVWVTEYNGKKEMGFKINKNKIK